MSAYPWSSRPDDLPLTVEEVCAALYEVCGDVTAASVRLKVGSLVLRKFIERSARARAVVMEMDRRDIDAARSKLREALHTEDHRRQDWAIRYYLNSANARSYGLSSTDDAAAHALDRPNLNIVVQPIAWADGTRIGPPAKPMIELHPSALPGKTPGDGSSSTD